jgi:hypothetical protein
MLEPEGALVHISAYTRMGVVERADAEPLPQPPWDAITELIRTYAGSETLEGQGRPDVARVGEDDILRAWFIGPELVSVPDGRVLTRTADQVVAAVYSVSTSAPGVLGEEKSAFESDLRDLLHETSSTGMFSQATGDTGLRIWQPRS